jgi:hypothetical protein
MPDVLYILDEAQLVVEDGFDVTAPSSTFYFTNGGSVTFLGPNTTFKATAPLVGPRAGMLFWGAQDAALAQRIEVGTGSALSGAIYFPGSHLDFRGTDTLSGCTQILADRVILTGRWTGAGPCTIPGTSPIVASRRVRLIE